MRYKICNSADVGKLKAYLYENKGEIVPSAIEQMYGNEAAVGMRLNHKMEIAVVAENESDGSVNGVISAISPNQDENWTIVALHVLGADRRKRIACSLIQKLEEELVNQHGTEKCSASVMNLNREARACYIVNGFEHEGKLSAVDSSKEIAVLGKIIQR